MPNYPQYPRLVGPGDGGSGPSQKTVHIVEGSDYYQTFSGGNFRSAIIDNITASWCQFGRTGRPIPPFTYGAIQNFAPTDTPELYWLTPLNIPKPTPSNGTLTATFSSDILTPSNGVPVVTPSQQIICAVIPASLSGATKPTLLANNIVFFGGPGGAATQSWTVNIPPGANSLILDGSISYVAGVGSPQPTFSLVVTGVQSGTQYLVTPVAGPTLQPEPPFACIIAPAADSQVTIAVTTTVAAGGSVSGTIQTIASFGTQAVAVQGGGTPVPVSLAPSQFVVPGLQPPTSVTLQIATVDLNLAAGNTGGIITDPGGILQVHVYEYAFDAVVNAFPAAGNFNPVITLEDTTGVVVRVAEWIAQSAAPVNIVYTPHEIKGNALGLAPWTAGKGLRAHAFNTSMQLAGHIVYAIY